MSPSRLFLAVSILTTAAHAHAASFVWDSKTSGQAKPVTRATLSNKVLIETLKGQDAFGHSVTALAPGRRQRSVLVENDMADIEAAYPDPRKAAVVLASDNCSGNACISTTMTVILPEGDSVKTYRVDSPSKITLVLNDSGVVTGGQADGIPVGTNQYGDQVTASYRFLPGAGFVVPGFKPQFARLVGAHPEDFFADEALRQPFAKATGMDKFRDLRQAIAVASPAVLVQGRYIVLQGCMPHDSGGNYSLVMIDAVSADYFWARYNGGKNRYSGGTRKLDRASVALFHESGAAPYDDVSIEIAPNGRIVYTPKAR